MPSTKENRVASLHVRNIDDAIVARLKERAKRHGRSAEAEHRAILEKALPEAQGKTFDEMAAELRARLAGRVHTPSVLLIREDRDSR
jgi:plasmid stability protein